MVDWRENLIWGSWNICNRTGRNTRDFHHVVEKQFAYISPFHIIFLPLISIKLHSPPNQLQRLQGKCTHEEVHVFAYTIGHFFFFTSTQSVTRVNWIYKKVWKIQSPRILPKLHPFCHNSLRLLLVTVDKVEWLMVKAMPRLNVVGPRSQGSWFVEP